MASEGITRRQFLKKSGAAAAAAALPSSQVTDTVYAHENHAIPPSTSSTLKKGLLHKPKPLSDFTLVDHERKEVTKQDLLGHYSLIMFGYLNCPEEGPCSTMFNSLYLLSKDLGDEVPCFMISSDPMRDRPETLASQMKKIGITADSSIGFLTTANQLMSERNAVSKLHHSITGIGLSPKDEGSGHVSLFFLINPKGEVCASLFLDATADVVRTAIDGCKNYQPNWFERRFR